MDVIYEPDGRAREYSELAANLYLKCDHGCSYCYAPPVLFTSRDQFKINPKPRKNIILRIRKDAKKMKECGDSRNVLICFLCDPYQKANDTYKITRQVIEIFNEYGIHYTILTKGGKRSEQDFDIFDPKLGTYAATLVFADEKYRKKYEPFAAPTQERIDALRHAHEFGIRTWVSLEPVFVPEQTYELIHLTHEFVDLYKVGKLNHNKAIESTINWTEFGNKVISILQSYGKEMYIKTDLKEYLNQ